MTTPPGPPTSPSGAPGRPPARLGRALRDLLAITAITGLLSLGLLELALRLFAPQYSPEMRQDILAGLYAADPATAYRLAPGARVPLKFDDIDTVYATNAQGLREDHAFGPPAPGRPRLLVLGDSFTFGWGVDGAQAFPHLLDGHRAAGGGTVESVNAGVPGYGPDNEAAWLRAYGWALQPRIVLVGFFVGNDVNDVILGMGKTTVDAAGRLVESPATRQAMAAGAPAPTAGSLGGVKGWLAAHSHAYVFLRRLAHTWWPALFPAPPTVQTLGLFETAPYYRTAESPAIRAGWEKTLAILDSMRAEAAAHGAGFAVVAIPAREQVEAAYWQDLQTRFGLRAADLDRDAPQRHLAVWSARTGASLIDLLPGFRAAAGPPLYLPHDPHWTPAGHALAAHLIADGLVRLGLFQ